MELKEIARELQGTAANLALRIPISWVSILTGPPVTVDGRTLDSRTQWLLQLLARSGQPPIEKSSVAEARENYDSFMLQMGGSAAPIGEMIDRTIEGPAGRMRVRLYRPAATARCTFATRCSLPSTVSRLLARGLPLGLNIRIRLLEGVPVALASFSNPTVALM